MAETDTDGEVPLLRELSMYGEMTPEMIVLMLPSVGCVALFFSRSSGEAL
ncbi:MAG: hypothetical protein ABW066_02335 [Sedimenticola sp.]